MGSLNAKPGQSKTLKMKFSLVVLIGVGTRAISLTEVDACTCSSADHCECPVLLDHGLIFDPEYYGKLAWSEAGASLEGTTRLEHYPVVLQEQARAVNHCGLDEYGTTVYGEGERLWSSTLYGTITLDEAERHDGCDGTRFCEDGRYTATKQHQTMMKDGVFNLIEDCLPDVAGQIVDEQTNCCCL